MRPSQNGAKMPTRNLAMTSPAIYYEVAEVTSLRLIRSEDIYHASALTGLLSTNLVYPFEGDHAISCADVIFG